jgi:site-specific recombinase XerD
MSKPHLVLIEDHTDPSQAFWGLWASFERAMRGKKQNANTQRTYRYGAGSLLKYLEKEGRSTDPAAITKSDLRGWLGSMLKSQTPATADVYYAAVRAFLRWLVAEGELTDNPCLGVSAPTVPDHTTEVIGNDDMVKLLAVCRGAGFHERRDSALFLVAFDAGLRRGELCNLMLEDVNLEQGVVSFVGKGGRQEVGYLGNKAIAALDRYLRTRARHPKASLTVQRGDEFLKPLWLTHIGKLTPPAFGGILERRAAQAGITRHLHPHCFRHGFADSLKSAGASDEDVQRLGRWRDPRVMMRYARVRADERARLTHKRLSPGDRL